MDDVVVRNLRFWKPTPNERSWCWRALLAVALLIMSLAGREHLTSEWVQTSINVHSGILLAVILSRGVWFTLLVWFISSLSYVLYAGPDPVLSGDTLVLTLEPFLLVLAVHFMLKPIYQRATDLTHIRPFLFMTVGLITVLITVSLTPALTNFLSGAGDEFALTHWWSSFAANFAGIAIGFPLTYLFFLDSHKTTQVRIASVLIAVSGLYFLSNGVRQNNKVFKSEYDTSLELAAVEMEAMLVSFFNELEIYQRSVTNYLSTQPGLSEEEFKNFVLSYSDIKDDFVVTEWLPKISLENRERYEYEMSLRLGMPIQISDLAEEGQHRVALRRRYYFPVTYIHPEWINKDSYAFDPSSSRSSNEAILEAVNSRKAVFRKPLNMRLKDGQTLPVMVAYEAVFDSKNLNQLRGLVLIAVKPQKVFNQASKHMLLKSFDFRLIDVNSGQIYYSPELGFSESGAKLSRDLKALGRLLKLELYPKFEAIDSNHVIEQSNGLILKSSLLFMLFSVFWLINNSRERFEEELKLRTKELEHSASKAIDSEKETQKLLQKKIKAEKQLRLSKVAFESASEAMLVLSSSGNVILSNHRFHELTGLSDHQSMYIHHLFEIIGEKNKSEQILKALPSHRKWRGELSIKAFNGQSIPILASIRLVRELEDYFVVVFSDITELKKVQNTLLLRANYDKLTGLPNRALFYDRISEQIKICHRESKSLCLLFVDLDKFKLINDSMGHEQGDVYLKHVASCLRNTVREADTVARLGGDEFTVMLPGLGPHDRVEALLNKIIGAIRTPLELDGKTVIPDASIGAAFYPSDANSAQELIKFADRAMYAAKESENRNYVIYDDEIAERWQTSEKLNDDIRSALSNDELDVVFQPFNESSTDSEHIAYEVLLRWNNREKGQLNASEFITNAVDVNLVKALDIRALELVMKYLRQLNSVGKTLECSINISVHSLLSKEFLQLVSDGSKLLCEDNRLFVELKENSLSHMGEELLMAIERVRALGVMVILDDFGCTNVGLSLLQNLPVDLVKIDRSLSDFSLHDHRSEMIIKAVVGLCRDFRIVPVVQFVESQKEIEWFNSIGVECFQGYALSQPLSFKELQSF
ncbi:EAL domain-containing protein [Methylophaga sp.]|uniref:bifunctional diguanylate cyclase/phosphodiesterase n=1 Tax=Methylophaga sp. TaxID=2024840 RepID=UPI003F69656B